MGFIPQALGIGAAAKEVLPSGATDFLGGGQGANKYRAQLADVKNADYSGDIGASLADFGKFRGMNEGNAQQQQAFIDQLRAQSMGQGPSVAQQQLAQAMAQNANQQAAAIGSVRGLNPALAAKMISDQRGQMGGELSQQAALLRANEQLGAMSQMGGALGQLRQQNLTSQQLSGGLAQGLGGLMNQQNANNIANQAQAQGINADIAYGNVKSAQDAYSKLGEAGMKLATAGAAPVAAAHGGEIMGPDAAQDDSLSMIRSERQNLRSDLRSIAHPMGPGYAHGGEISQEHRDFHTALMNAQSKKGIGSLAEAMMGGGKVPGKAKKEGDSYDNDTVPAMLSPGEIVIPRSKASPEGAKEFVEALQAHRESLSNLERLFCGGKV